MDRLKMESLDMTKANIDKIAELFPQVVTEVADTSGAKDENGKPLLKKAIDFEKLKLILSAGTGNYVVADDEQERYEFTWVGKRQAMIDAATPIRKTLRPCPEESKDWETTENLYVEGDNLEVLKLLQESYLGKVKMIYIDPPYNTGKDFIYKDNFAQSREEYEEELGMRNEEGNRLFQNTETNGRFHSDWCSMIYPRLQLARNLLTDDGVIFISIDDNEVENLKKIGNEIFGEENFISDIVWERSYAPINMVKHFSQSHDYILCYAKQIDQLECNGLPRPESTNAKYSNPDNDYRGLWRAGDLSVGPIIESKVYEIITPSGRKCMPPKGRCWLYTKERYEQMVADNRIWFGEKGENIPAPKRFLSEVKQGLTPMTIWKYSEVGHTQDSMRELREIFDGEKVFDYSKPVKLLKQIISLYSNNLNNDIILDFFSGSATTAHAVMQLNAKDGGNRKFIMVQLPEVCASDSEAAKAGYKTICEIGKERIRRAGAKIIEEQKAKNNGLFTEDAKPLDTGFRVFKLDTTNMKDVYYAAGQLSQKELWNTVNNVKDDRSDIDLLYGSLLDWGVQLTMPHTTEQIEGFTVHTVNSPLTDEIDLIACFESKVSETLVRAIAARKPTRALFCDSSFADSANKINVFEIFKLISSNTAVKVI